VVDHLPSLHEALGLLSSIAEEDNVSRKELLGAGGSRL
jgi:hypothetical protein